MKMERASSWRPENTPVTADEIQAVIRLSEEGREPPPRPAFAPHTPCDLADGLDISPDEAAKLLHEVRDQRARAKASRPREVQMRVWSPL